MRSTSAPQEREHDDRADRDRTGPPHPRPVALWLSDGWITTRRNLIKIRRVPDIVVFTTLQPILFVLLFSSVYAGSIRIPGSSHTEFIMAGIFARPVVFGSTFSGSAIANDLRDGIIDRFRTLPMRPSAVLIGRTNGDLLIDTLSTAVMIVTGLVVGWRVHSSPLEAAAGVAPNPVSTLVLAARTLFGTVPPGTPAASSWTLQHPILAVLIGIGVLLVVFVPLAIRRFGRITSR